MVVAANSYKVFCLQLLSNCVVKLYESKYTICSNCSKMYYLLHFYCIIFGTYKRFSLPLHRQNKGTNNKPIRTMELVAKEIITYNSFDDVSDDDMKKIEMARKYSNGQKERTFNSYKDFWKKLPFMIYVIGNGTYDDPEFLFGLQVSTPSYKGQPNKIYITNWSIH